VRVEHECLVVARLGGLDAGGDAVELGVGVQRRVLYVGIAAPYVSREQAHTALDGLRQRLLVLGDDHDRGPGDRHPWVLVRGGLDAARHHEADVHPVVHVIGGEKLVEAPAELGLVEVDLEVQGLHAFEESLEVALEKQHRVSLHPEALPDPVTEDEARIEHGDHRLPAVSMLAVDIDEDIAVAIVGGVFVRSLHGDSRAGAAKRRLSRSRQRLPRRPRATIDSPENTGDQG
jgi:hypothetical protein